MKRNDLMNIKTLEIKELQTKVVKAKQELADLTIEKNMKNLKNIKSITNKRKELAQMMTVVRQKELLGEIESRVQNQESSENVSNVSNVSEVSKVKNKSKKEKVEKEGEVSSI